MSKVEVLLTVGKLDASLALLTTNDHHVIEFPTVLLPDNVKAGSIVKLSVSQNLDEEKKRRELFKEIQNKILEKYGTHKPKPPVLKIVNVTQTSCVLAWDPLYLGSARLKSLILYRQGVRSTVIPSPLKATTTKISGLSVDTDYEFQLKLSTTSGQYWSEKVKMHTHKMTDMSGITVCLGQLDPLQNISEGQIRHSLLQIGARPLQHHVAIDTTHFITNDPENEEDPELIKAKNSNIPIVRPEWVRASEVERRIVGVRGFYLDADQGILKSYQFPPLSDASKSQLEKQEESSVEPGEGVARSGLSNEEPPAAENSTENLQPVEAAQPAIADDGNNEADSTEPHNTGEITADTEEVDDHSDNTSELNQRSIEQTETYVEAAPATASNQLGAESTTSVLENTETNVEQEKVSEATSEVETEETDAVQTAAEQTAAEPTTETDELKTGAGVDSRADQLLPAIEAVAEAGVPEAAPEVDAEVVADSERVPQTNAETPPGAAAEVEAKSEADVGAPEVVVDAVATETEEVPLKDKLPTDADKSVEFETEKHPEALIIPSPDALPELDDELKVVETTSNLAQEEPDEEEGNEQENDEENDSEALPSNAEGSSTGTKSKKKKNKKKKNKKK